MSTTDVVALSAIALLTAINEVSTTSALALEETAFVTNWVVASCVVFVPGPAVGAKMLPHMSIRPLNDASPFTYNLLFNETSELTTNLPFNDKSFVTLTL